MINLNRVRVLTEIYGENTEYLRRIDGENTEYLRRILNADCDAHAVSVALSISAFIVDIIKKGGVIYVKNKNGDSEKLTLYGLDYDEIHRSIYDE